MIIRIIIMVATLIVLLIWLAYELCNKKIETHSIYRVVFDIVDGKDAYVVQNSYDSIFWYNVEAYESMEVAILAARRYSKKGAVITFIDKDGERKMVHRCK